MLKKTFTKPIQKKEFGLRLKLEQHTHSYRLGLKDPFLKNRMFQTFIPLIKFQVSGQVAQHVKLPDMAFTCPFFARVLGLVLEARVERFEERSLASSSTAMLVTTLPPSQTVSSSLAMVWSKGSNLLSHWSDLSLVSSSIPEDLMQESPGRNMKYEITNLILKPVVTMTAFETLKASVNNLHIYLTQCQYNAQQCWRELAVGSLPLAK